MCLLIDQINMEYEVVSCDSMPVENEKTACTNMFDGSPGRKVQDGVCFKNQCPNKGWVEVNLAYTVDIGRITLLTADDG